MPERLKDYVGQENLKKQLIITIEACKRANRPLPHMLFSGAPGLGKTTIAKVIANEIGANFIEVMASSLNTAEDVESVLMKLGDDSKDILFIDEIHRLNPKVEELLYPVMTDFEFEMSWKENGRTVSGRFWVPPFTLIGATTLAGDVSRPLRDRFGIQYVMKNYTEEEIETILMNLAEKECIGITEDAVSDIARRAKGVARIAINYFKRCQEYALYAGREYIDLKVTTAQFDILGIDEIGLDERDYKVLEYLAQQTNPVGIDTLVAATDIDKPTITNIIEPYLVQRHFIERTSRGRKITTKGIDWLYRRVATEAPSEPAQVRGLRRLGDRRGGLV